MASLKSVLAAATLLAAALAQPNIAFTSVPAVVVAGQSYNISWSGGDRTAVTITLRKGNPSDLSTIGTLADRVTQSYYLWTVESSLPTANDYALQIKQGQNDINYSGLFSLVGGSGSSSISYSATSTFSLNGTISATSSTVTAIGTAATSAAVGVTMSRNTTFSSQMLTSSHAITTATMATTHASASIVTQSTNAPTANVATNYGSSATFAIGLLGAIMFL